MTKALAFWNLSKALQLIQAAGRPATADLEVVRAKHPAANTPMSPADWSDMDRIYDALPPWRHDPTDTQWPVEVDSVFVDEIVDLLRRLDHYHMYVYGHHV